MTDLWFWNPYKFDEEPSDEEGIRQIVAW